jgi:hypothetical protein
VKNVLAAGGCNVNMNGNRIALTSPRLVRDESRRVVPPPVRLVLRTLRVTDFLEMTIAARAE